MIHSAKQVEIIGETRGIFYEALALSRAHFHIITLGLCHYFFGYRT